MTAAIIILAWVWLSFEIGLRTRFFINGRG